VLDHPNSSTRKTYTKIAIASEAINNLLNTLEEIEKITYDSELTVPYRKIQNIVDDELDAWQQEMAELDAAQVHIPSALMLSIMLTSRRRIRSMPSEPTLRPSGARSRTTTPSGPASAQRRTPKRATTRNRRQDPLSLILSTTKNHSATTVACYWSFVKLTGEGLIRLEEISNKAEMSMPVDSSYGG